MYKVLFDLSNTVGVIGVILVLVAYFFITNGRWRAHSLRFQVLNFLGAVLVLFSLYFHWNLASVLIEVAWIIISVIGIYRVLFHKKG